MYCSNQFKKVSATAPQESQLILIPHCTKKNRKTFCKYCANYLQHYLVQQLTDH